LAGCISCGWHGFVIPVLAYSQEKTPGRKSRWLVLQQPAVATDNVLGNDIYKDFFVTG
jgi:hypothetical protein